MSKHLVSCHPWVDFCLHGLSLMQQNGRSSGYSDDANFFNFDCDMSTRTNASDTVQAARYMEDQSRDIQSLKLYPVVMDMSLRYNTVITSSASVERLFGAGGQIMNDSSSKWTVRWIIREAIAFTSKQYWLNVLNISRDSVWRHGVWNKYWPLCHFVFCKIFGKIQNT